jgi:hypothetical protein
MYYEKVLQIDSTKTGTRMALALISENNGQFGTTDSLLNAELRFTQSPEFVEFFRGQILLERGDTTGAISALNLGKEATTYSRNAREFYKGLPQDILIRLDGGN